MATVYKIEIKVTSPWTCHPEKDMKKMIEQALSKLGQEDNDLYDDFENLEVNVEIIA